MGSGIHCKKGDLVKISNHPVKKTHQFTLPITNYESLLIYAFSNLKIFIDTNLISKN